MKKIYRNSSDSKIAGVCSGIGDYLEVDPVLIRLIFKVNLPKRMDKLKKFITKIILFK